MQPESKTMPATEASGQAIVTDRQVFVENRSAVFTETGRTVAWVIRDVYRLYESESQKILAKEEVTIAHWYYLRVLSEHGTLNQLELSKRVGISPATAVPALDNLESRGLVKRTRDAGDRRKYDVSLTTLGSEMIEKLLPSVVKLLEASLQGAAEKDIAAFWRVLELAERNLLAIAAGDIRDSAR